METTETLWSLDDIARYYKRSVRTATRIVRRAGFPPPTPADPKRWVASQVIAHAASGKRPEADVLEHRVRPGQRVVRRRAAA